MRTDARALSALLRTDFPSFIAKTFATVSPGAAFLPNWHIDLIAEYLEAIRRGEITRLIINMPPRALKSVCVSVAWPAWLLGRDPAARVLAASYAGALAIKHSLDCRQVMGSRWYRQAFPCTVLSADQNEKRKFMTTANGFRLATSVGGTLTGEGGNYLIIDDPINPQAAESRMERETVARWFDHTFASRLDDKRRGAMVLVMQRLHAADLTGHLLAKGGWEHVSLPALAPEEAVYDFGRVQKRRARGEALHAVREDEALIARAKRELGSRAFSAQYQQEPLPEEGCMVRPWWFARHDTTPSGPERIVQSWDTAIKDGLEHDASCCLTFYEKDGISYLAEACVLRAQYPGLLKAVRAQAEKYRPHAVLIEDKASGQQLLQDLRAGSSLPLVARRPRADKVTRLAAASAMIEAGRVSLPREAGWLAAFQQEILAFPAARHDDQVDALTQYLEWLRESGNAAASLRIL